MKHLNRFVPALFAFALLYALFPPRVHAYLDPGTGSYVLQILLAALFGALLVLKLSWNRLTSFFRNLFSRRPEDKQDED